MRVAIHQTSEIANRAGRVLLAERSLTALGLVDSAPSGRNERVERVTALADYDVVFSDADDPVDIAHRAAQAGVACVVRAETAPPWTATRPLLVGATLGGAIAPALAVHEAAATAADEPVTLAWTVPGRPLRRGTAVAFPDPVGSLWADRRDPGPAGTRLVAPVGGEWAAAMAMVGPAGTPRRVVGIADLAAHLDALALAAGVKTVATGGFAPGVRTAADAAEPYLLSALGMGLEVAGFHAA